MIIDINGMKNTQQTIGIEKMNYTRLAHFLAHYLSPVWSLDLSCPPPSYDTNLKYYVLHYSFYAQLFPSILE